MTAQAAPECSVYYCLVCGPCLQEIIETDCGPRTITVHDNIPHPDEMTFDEEESPQ